MFSVSNERKGRFVVTTEKTIMHNALTPINSNSLVIKSQVGNLNALSINHKDMNKTNIYFQGEPICSSALTTMKKKIRFHLSKEAPVKKRKLKRVKEVKQKTKRLRNEIYSIGRWKYDEHQRFVEALIKYGNDWKQVQKLVKTRSSTQARSHAQKFFVKIQKAKLLKFNLDLSKNSIKKLHDLMNNLSDEDYKKLLKSFNSVAFERKKPFKKHLKKNSFNYSDEMSYFESELFKEEEDILNE